MWQLIRHRHKCQGVLTDTVTRVISNIINVFCIFFSGTIVTCYFCSRRTQLLRVGAKSRESRSQFFIAKDDRAAAARIRVWQLSPFVAVLKAQLSGRHVHVFGCEVVVAATVAHTLLIAANFRLYSDKCIISCSSEIFFLLIFNARMCINCSISEVIGAVTRARK